MKFFNIACFAASATAIAIETRAIPDNARVPSEVGIVPRQRGSLSGRQNFRERLGLIGGNNNNGNNGSANQDNDVDTGSNTGGNVNNGNTDVGDDIDNEADAGTDANNGGSGAVAEGDTLVLFEVNGVPGNECITFRNNGEMVDAACVNEAADRQVTPTGGQLRVQRGFSAGFRPDLVGIEAACVGFNGTHFRAEDCAAPGIELVQFDGAELRAIESGACASGHDDLAQLTVDPAGVNCAQFTSTVVAPTPP